MLRTFVTRFQCNDDNLCVGIVEERPRQLTARVLQDACTRLATQLQDLEMAKLGWVDWFKNRQLLGPIRNIAPAEVKENYYAQRDVLDMVGWNEAIGLL